MEKDTEKTVVIFRKFSDGDIIAIFPEIPGTYEEFTCSSYMHIGQHGSCHPVSLINGGTKLASETEYHDLFIELESIGYNLEVKKRMTQEMYNNRVEVLRQYK